MLVKLGTGLGRSYVEASKVIDIICYQTESGFDVIVNTKNECYSIEGFKTIEEADAVMADVACEINKALKGED